MPGAPYTGGPADPLTIAIKLHQKHRGGVQDGRISPAQQTLTYDWMILALSNNVSSYLASTWPRIEHHPKCPAALAASVIKCVGPWGA